MEEGTNDILMVDTTYRPRTVTEYFPEGFSIDYRMVQYKGCAFEETLRFKGDAICISTYDKDRKYNPRAYRRFLIDDTNLLYEVRSILDRRDFDLNQAAIEIEKQWVEQAALNRQNKMVELQGQMRVALRDMKGE